MTTSTLYMLHLKALALVELIMEKEGIVLVCAKMTAHDTEGNYQQQGEEAAVAIKFLKSSYDEVMQEIIGNNAKQIGALNVDDNGRCTGISNMELAENLKLN